MAGSFSAPQLQVVGRSISVAQSDAQKPSPVASAPPEAQPAPNVAPLGFVKVGRSTLLLPAI
eukprot:scaffold201922_cov25-Prasinocladus_malaysianus.AAC.1